MGLKNEKTSIKKATMINFFGKYTNILIQLIYGAILARLLTPEDFGVVAVVLVFTSFFSLIANMGIGPAIIQNRCIDENDTNNIFSLTVYIGIAVGILFALFSIPISIFYNNHVYIPIGVLLGISLLFNTMNIVPNAMLLKAHRFKLVNIRLVIVSIIAAIPTIILAFMGLKYYSIVIHSILISVFTIVWNLFTVNPKFIIKVDSASFRKIKEFSSYQLAFSIINYFSRNTDSLLIGKFNGNAALGFYDKSYRLMLYPVQNLTHVITPVLHPILSLHQNDENYIYEKYLKVVKILSLLGVFVSAYSYFAAKEIIILLYGSQWYESIASFRFLALSIWGQMVTSSSGSIFMSIGNTKLLFKAGTYSSILLVSATVIGISLGDINSVAICVSIAYNINFFLTVYMLIGKGFEKYSSIDFFKKFIPDLFVFIVTASVLFLISRLELHNLFLSLTTKLFFGGLAYVLALIATKQSKYFLSLFKK